MTELPGIDAASVSYSDCGTEIIQMLTVSPKKLGHNLAWTQPQSEGKILYQQNTVGKEIASSPPELDRILEWKYKYLQYEGKTCRGMEPRIAAVPKGTA